jgi:hypothetical protein
MVKNKKNSILLILLTLRLAKPVIKHRNRSSQKGQLAIEGVLILVLLLSLSIFASRYIRDQNLMGKIISEPWSQIAGMMATGNWQAAQSALDENLHPHVNTMTREGD